MTDQIPNERLAVVEERLNTLGEGFSEIREFHLEAIRTQARTAANLDRAADAIAETSKLQQQNTGEIVTLKTDMAVQKNETDRVKKGQNIVLVAFLGLMTTIIGAVLGANFHVEAAPIKYSEPPAMHQGAAPDSSVTTYY
jgi:carbamoylphosphate synthase small subunit